MMMGLLVYDIWLLLDAHDEAAQEIYMPRFYTRGAAIIGAPIHFEPHRNHRLT
jgi:hypothetical protein